MALDVKIKCLGVLSMGVLSMGVFLDVDMEEGLSLGADPREHAVGIHVNMIKAAAN